MVGGGSSQAVAGLRGRGAKLVGLRTRLWVKPGRGLSLCEQDAEDVGGGADGALAEALFVKAAERVGQHYEWVVGDAADVRHSLAAGDEWLGADDGGGDAALFKGDAVVHTAR